MPAKQIIIKGKVQGVFFRATARKIALQLQLTGHVRNQPDGSVEAIVTGSKQSVDEFIDWCKQGPPNANVHSVEVNDTNEKQYEGFHIIR